MEIPFNEIAYARVLEGSYIHVEIISTGREIETSEDVFRKELILRCYKEEPTDSKHYVVTLPSEEIAELSKGNDTDIVFIEFVS